MVLVAATAIIHKNKILLLQNSNEQIGKWGPPAGHQEKGETPEEVAIRETKEETNLQVTLKRILQIGYFYYKQKDYMFVSYLAKANSIKNLKVQEKEVSKYVWASLQDIKKGKYPFRKKFLKEPMIMAFNQRSSKNNLFKQYIVEN